MNYEQIVADVNFVNLETHSFSMPLLITAINLEASQAECISSQIDGFENLISYAKEQLKTEECINAENKMSILALSDVLINPGSFNAKEDKNEALAHLDAHIFQESIQILEDNREPFKIFDIRLSDEEITALNNTKITEIGEYSLLGDLHLIETELPKFLQDHTSSDEKDVDIITHLVSQLAKEVVAASGMESAWVVLRTSFENPSFDTHRWHTDGPVYHNLENPAAHDFQYKFIATLKGDPTLFYPLPTDLRAEFTQNQNDREYWHQKLDDALTITPKIGQGAVFTVGDDMLSAVHSEPSIKQDRIFFAVVPGSKEQVAWRQEWLQNLDQAFIDELEARLR